jgi:hypothetical protein
VFETYERVHRLDVVQCFRGARIGGAVPMLQENLQHADEQGTVAILELGSRNNLIHLGQNSTILGYLLQED